jgi:acyl-CoA thioester hydrolase
VNRKGKQSKEIPPEKGGEIQIRVRFSETDKMGITWHGNYFSWFEMGRTELLRQAGFAYKDLEAAGTMFAVVSVECSYKHPAAYDDLLTLKTRVVRVTPVRIEHEYRLYRDNLLLAVGKTVLASVDLQGRIKPIPDEILNLF